jgi:hypothetical protein
MKLLKAIFGVPLAAIGVLFSLFIVWIAFTALAGIFDTSYSFGERTREQVGLFNTLCETLELS